MPCFSPLSAWRLPEGGRLFFGPREPCYQAKPVQVPCGQCVGCRLERSRIWAVRCVHEASLYDRNCFITITYRDDCVPVGRTLVKKHFQDFMKRLRRRIEPQKVRFYACGEYGEKFGRPHYHACLFGFDFSDKVFWKVSPAGEKIYRSAFLEELWPFGHSSVGAVTFESAAYVARYIMDKKNGSLAFAKYNDIDWETGEILAERIPEYTDMSRRPGIGRGWFEKYVADVYPDDFVIVNGKKCRVPRYYDNAYEVLDPEAYLRVKVGREGNGVRHAANNTPDRLRVREEVLKAKLNKLNRSIE